MMNKWWLTGYAIEGYQMPVYVYIYLFIWDYDRAWAEMGTVLKHPATEMTEGWFDHGDACLDVPLYVVKGWSWMMTENIFT